MASKAKNYDEAYSQLEKLVAEIEKPERSLDSIAKDVKKALELIEQCRECIRGDKEKIDKMLE